MTTTRVRAVLRIGATLGLPDVLNDLGSNSAELLKQAGVDPKLFDNADNQISLAARGHLLERCAKVTRCPHFGLLVGGQVTLDSLGLVGQLVKHSPDVRAALEALCRYFHLHAEGVAVEVKVDGGQALLSYNIYEATIPGIDQTSDGAVAAMLNIMRELCGPDFKATESWFAHRRPLNIEPYRKLLGVRLEFDADVYALVFSSSWLTRALPPTDRTLLRLLQEKVVEQEQLHGRSFPEQVQAVMRTALTFNQVTADRLAAMFDMHVRTFHRHLSEHGTSFQVLLDKTRCAVACHLLEDDSRSLPRITELLGFAEVRSFIRAFKRWTGSTPTEWRKTRTRSMYTAASTDFAASDDEPHRRLV